MAHSSSLLHPAESLPANQPDVLRYAVCPMCHASTAMPQNEIETGGDWRCVRCGQHWDPARLAAVAAYAAWTVDRDCVVKRSTDGSSDRAPDRDESAEPWAGRS